MDDDLVTWSDLRQQLCSIKKNLALLPEMTRMVAIIRGEIALLTAAWNATHPKQRDTGTLKLGDEQGDIVPNSDSLSLGRKISPKRSGGEAHEVNEAVAVDSLTFIEYRKKHAVSARSENRTSTADEDLKAQDHEFDEEEKQQEEAAPREEENWALLQPTGPGPGAWAKWANRTGLNISTQISSKPTPVLVFFSNDKRRAASQLSISPVLFPIGVFVSDWADHTRCKTPSELKTRRCSATTERPYRRRLLQQMGLVHLDGRNLTDLPQFMTGQRSAVRAERLVLRPSGLADTREVAQRVEHRIWILLHDGAESDIEGWGRTGHSAVGPGPGVKEPEPPKPGWALQRPSYWPVSQKSPF